MSRPSVSLIPYWDRIREAKNEAERNFAWSDCFVVLERVLSEINSGAAAAPSTQVVNIINNNTATSQSNGMEYSKTYYGTAAAGVSIAVGQPLHIDTDGTLILAHAGTDPKKADGVCSGVDRDAVTGRQLVGYKVTGPVKLKLTAAISRGRHLYLSATPGYATDNIEEAGKTMTQELGPFVGYWTDETYGTSTLVCVAELCWPHIPSYAP